LPRRLRQRRCGFVAVPQIPPRISTGPAKDTGSIWRKSHSKNIPAQGPQGFGRTYYERLILKAIGVNRLRPNRRPRPAPRDRVSARHAARIRQSRELKRDTMIRTGLVSPRRCRRRSRNSARITNVMKEFAASRARPWNRRRWISKPGIDSLAISVATRCDPCIGIVKLFDVSIAGSRIGVETA